MWVKLSTCLVKINIIRLYGEWMCNKWRWVINFMPWPLYSWGMSTQYPFSRRLGRSQTNSRLCGEEEVLQFVSCPDHSLVVTPTELSWLVSWIFITQLCKARLVAPLYNVYCLVNVHLICLLSQNIVYNTLSNFLLYPCPGVLCRKKKKNSTETRGLSCTSVACSSIWDIIIIKLNFNVLESCKIFQNYVPNLYM
jgi:hypothetical protein